ncbi:MAG: hypothetical protein ABIH24_06065 [Verrucomicrobiota bacterium]
MRWQCDNNPLTAVGYGRILALMFYMGVYGLMAQILLLREFLVVFFGNELTIGAMFSAWLVLIGAGSLLAKLLVARVSAECLRILLVVLLTLAAFLLPLQVGMIRIVRTVFQVAYGENVAFFPMLAGLAAILAPGCLIIGIAFPCACRLAARHQLFAVSRVYTAESLGSMVAGAVFSFWLVWVMSPLAVAALAGVFVLLGATWLANARISRWLLGLIAFAFAVGACCPACLAPLERASVEARWRSFGALPSSGSSSPSASRLLAACDSRYQNLALIETEGQMTLYANGQVMAVFPDAVTGEHKIHFIMAQKPDARRVLLIGGNPVNDIPELLKYPLEQLVYVELDEKIGRLLASVATSAYRQALRDPRLAQIHMDAPRYVKQYGRSVGNRSVNGGGEMARSGNRRTPPFDAVLVDASEPATIALNRFYTQEFYRDIHAILSPGGFLYTAVGASEDLQGETAFLSASIAKALRAVFDRVLVTYGTRNQFFAGAANSPITLARATLFRRNAGTNIKTRYFRPEYFLDNDEINPEKIEFVERRLAAIPVPINTILKPVSTFYQIALWSRFSGSGLESMLARLARLRPVWVAGALLGFGVICFGIGMLFGRRSACVPLNAFRAFGFDTASSFAEEATEARLPDKSTEWQGDTAADCFYGAQWTSASAVVPQSGAVFSRSMLALVIAATGLCGMALELILIFVFQSLLGYVYSKIGLIVAMFMLGLTLGAFWAPRLIRSGARLQWRAFTGMEIILIMEAVCIPWLITALASGPMTWIPWGWVEALIYGVITGTGALVGAQFALANELMSGISGTSPGWAPRSVTVSSADAMADALFKLRGRNAALTDAADHMGAALGGLVVGVLLLPLFGITTACFLLAALKVSSLLCLLAARRAGCNGELKTR